MFLELSHTKLNVYTSTKELTIECYRITKNFPIDEKYAMVQQIRRAALSVHLNLAEGSSRRSVVERIRYYEIARGSVIEIDTAFGVAVELGYCQKADLEVLGALILKGFKQLSALIIKTGVRP
ncbi:MAG TPA: four helix bundle protein [Chitinophagaceae bacterium]|nr:four helix bundle protein [Chitinophagaceae bacterium]